MSYYTKIMILYMFIVSYNDKIYKINTVFIEIIQQWYQKMSKTYYTKKIL